MRNRLSVKNSRLAHKVATTLLLFLVFMGNGRAERTQFAPGELLVGYAPGMVSASGASINAVCVGQANGFDGRLGISRVKVSQGISLESAASQLRMNPAIQFVEPNYTLHALNDYANDPLLDSGQYAPETTQATLAWGIYNPKSTIVIAIVDTGVQYTHPDLVNRIYRQNGAMVGYDLANRDTDPMDDHGHGTHCAGIAAAEANNGIGIAGMAGFNPAGSPYGARIMPVKVLKGDGSGSTSDVADGITWAADHGANIISISLGSSQYSETLNRAVQYAWSKGCLIAAAAGNDGASSKFYPAANANVVSVASTDSNDGLSYFSNYGSWVTVAAPGSYILSTILGSDYSWMSGTSMATPCVAGEAALIWAQSPGLSNQQVVDLIKTTTDPLIPGSALISAGEGRINALRAVQLASSNQIATVTSIQAAGDIVGGNALVLSIGLSQPAGAGGVAVSLSSANPAVGVPSTVKISEGLQSITVAGFTSAVSTVKTGAIRATVGTHAVTCNTSVSPLRPVLIQLPTQALGRTPFTIRVTLNGSLPTKTTTLYLRADTGAVTLPSSIQIGAGKASVDFTAATRKVSRALITKVTATLNGGNATGQIIVKP